MDSCFRAFEVRVQCFAIAHLVITCLLFCGRGPCLRGHISPRRAFDAYVLVVCASKEPRTAPSTQFSSGIGYRRPFPCSRTRPAHPRPDGSGSSKQIGQCLFECPLKVDSPGLLEPDDSREGLWWAKTSRNNAGGRTSSKCGVPLLHSISSR